MSLIRKFAGQAVVYGISSILSRIVYYLLVVVLLTHLLGDKTVDFGTFAYFYAYAAVLLSLFSFRLDTALFRFGNKNENLDTAFNSALVPVLVGALVLVMLGLFADQPIANLINFPDDSRYVRWFAFILAFDVVNLLPFAKLRLTDKAKQFAIYKVFNVALSSVLILFFLFALPKLIDTTAIFPKLIDWIFVANLIASGVLFVTLLPVWKGFRFKVDAALLRKMLYYALPLVIVGVANGFIQFFAVPLQKALLGGDQASNLAAGGVYDFTRRVAGLFVMFTTAFNYAAEPFFFNNSSSEDRKTLYGKICRLFTLVGGLVVIGMCLSQDLLKYLAPSDYWDSMSLLPILLMAYLFLGIYYNVSIWYKLSDQTWYGAMLSFVGLALTLGISYIYLPKLGYAASAWATLASYSVMVVLAYIIGQKNYPIAYPVKKILLDLLVITGLLATIYLLRESVSVPVKYGAYVAIMLVYIAYLWRAERKEWRTILRLPT